MKRWAVVCGASLYLLAVGATAAELPKVAVLEFSAKKGASADLADMLADLVANAIRSLERHQVIGVSDIKSMIGFEQVKDKLGCDDTSCLVEIGGALGVDYIVVGNFGRLGNQFLVNLKLINPRKARVDAGISRQIAGGEENLGSAIPTIIGDLFGSRTVRHTSPAVVDEPGEGGRYSDLIGEVKRKKDAEVRRIKELESSWMQIKEFANMATVDKAERLAALKQYIKDFPEDQGHRQQIEIWMDMLADDEEPSEAIDMSAFQVEWFGLRVYGGNFGGGGSITLLSLRWQYFYWDIMKGSGVGSDGDSLGRLLAATGGTSFGFPWCVTDSGRHELRFGAGLFGGWVDHAPGESLGPILLLEAYYLYHLAEYFSIQTGMELNISTMPLNESEGLPAPVFNVFLGFKT